MSKNIIPGKWYRKKALPSVGIKKVGVFNLFGRRAPTREAHNDLIQKIGAFIYECEYHLVFCPQYRYRILKNELGEYTKQQIYRWCRQKELVEVLELNVQPDQVVVSIVPKHTIWNFMGSLGSVDISPGWPKNDPSIRLSPTQDAFLGRFRTLSALQGRTPALCAGASVEASKSANVNTS